MGAIMMSPLAHAAFSTASKEVVGALYYGVAAIAAGHWLILARRRVRHDLSSRRPWSRVNEISLVLALLGLAAYGRLYALRVIPYGVEGDECKWVHEVLQVMVDGVQKSKGSDWTLDSSGKSISFLSPLVYKPLLHL
jgi:hypothetical protein